MYLFINGTNRTENLLQSTVNITDELQERINTASFTLAGYNPSYMDDIKLYEGFSIVSATSTSVTLNKNYDIALQNNIFRVGDKVWIAVGEADEEWGTVLSIESNTGLLKLNFATFTNTPAAGEIVGRKKFAGNIIDREDSNNTILKNVEFEVTCLDYTRIFDKELLNDTYENKDSRYIINDFCNTTINFNQAIDEFNYANTTELRAAWTESGDGGNPTLDTSDHQETTGSGVFNWTFSGGTATWALAITPIDIRNFTGVATGTPAKGRVGFWYKADDFTKITTVTIRIGSDSSNYGSYTFTPTDNEWNFIDGSLSTTGTPNWEAVDYAAIVVVQTASSEIRIDGIRILENSFFRHFPYVQAGDFEDFRIPRKKPTETMQRIADALAWYWYIDYDKYIHLFPGETIAAPFGLNETSNNFNDLNISYDASRIVNRQVVEGAEETSASVYSQVVEGNGVVKEWIMKNKFKNLVVKLNNGSTTDTAEAGTNTTTINATAHGLVAGDYIVNRNRANAVREVMTVPSANQFTVETVTGQTAGDVFSLFTSKIVGVEGIGDEAGSNYMSNFNQKSIRNSQTEPTIIAGQFLLFQYNEVTPIRIRKTNNVSVTLMRTVLGYTNGIFDGQPIVDKTLTTSAEASQTAEAVLRKYSNVIISASFRTNQEGLESGQIIRIKDTTSSLRNIDQDFVIQSVSMEQVAWGENRYDVKCSSLLFGMLELLQQILANGRKIQVDEDAVVSFIEDQYETVILSDVFTSAVDGNKSSETVTISDSVTSDIITPPFQWGPGGSPQLRWNLGSWS